MCPLTGDFKINRRGKFMQEVLDTFLNTITQEGRYVCPVCTPNRKKVNQRERTLSVSFKSDGLVFLCHHCEISGKRSEDKPAYVERPKKVTAISVPKESDSGIVSQYLKGRGIDHDKIKDRFALVTGKRYFNAKGELNAGEFPAIGFVYGDKEAVKWRPLNDKRFTQDGAARTFWGIEHAKKSEAKTIVICEGEVDCLSVASSIIDDQIAILSVPNGAPQRVANRKMDAKEDNKFSYVWEAKAVMKSAEKIILATDSDEAGEALREELARRIGRAKCYQVQYPDGTKDMNDVLQQHGTEKIVDIVNAAEPLPLEGVYTVDDYKSEVTHLYTNGVIGGLSTGMPVVDELFTVVQGQLSVITGVPGSGKSEFIDQLMVNLAKNYDWKFAVASFENPPPLHIAKLAEKIVGKPFFDGPNGRMNKEEADNALTYIHNHWLFLEQRSGELVTIDSVLDRAQQAVMRMGVRGLVIDPYNYIAQQSNSDNEHQSINDLLTRLVAFARANDVHIWFIAHPSKMPTDASGSTAVPKGMNISGSASFFAKADLGITVHQNKDRGVEIHCWKVRFKWIGKVGKVQLKYDVPTGRYSEKVFKPIPIPQSLQPNKSWHENDDDWL